MAKKTKAQASAKHKTKLERRFILTLMILLSVLLGSVIATQLINPLLASTKESIESTRIALRLKADKTGKQRIEYDINLVGDSWVKQVAHYQAFGLANKQVGYKALDCTAVPSERYVAINKSKGSPIDVHPKAQQVCLRVTYRTQFPSHRRALEKLPYYERQSFARMVVTDPSQLRANSPTTSFPHRPELILEQENQNRFRYNVIAAKDQIVKLGYYEQKSQSTVKESSSYNTKGCPKSNSQYKEVADWNPSSKSQAEALAGSIQIESVSPDFVCLLLVYNRYDQEEDVYHLSRRAYQILKWKTADQLQESLAGDYRRMRLKLSLPERPFIEAAYLNYRGSMLLVECPVGNISSPECQQFLQDLTTFCQHRGDNRLLTLPECLSQIAHLNDSFNYQDYQRLYKVGWIQANERKEITYPLSNLKFIVCPTFLFYSSSSQARDCLTLQNARFELFVPLEEIHVSNGRRAGQALHRASSSGIQNSFVSRRHVVEVANLIFDEDKRVLVSNRRH